MQSFNETQAILEKRRVSFIFWENESQEKPLKTVLMLETSMCVSQSKKKLSNQNLEILYSKIIKVLVSYLKNKMC